jgi:hypothetical protein
VTARLAACHLGRPVEVTWELALPLWEKNHGTRPKTDAEWHQAWLEAEDHAKASRPRERRERGLSGRPTPRERNCLECGASFDPKGTKRRYCRDKGCSQRARNRRRPKIETRTDRVVAAKGASRCSKCGYEGRTWAFWWDDDDKLDGNMETVWLLCAKCRPPILRAKARERKWVHGWEVQSEIAIITAQGLRESV